MKRILGEVSKSVADYWDIRQYENKKIVLYPEIREHCKERHMADYASVADYYYVMDSLEEVVSDPDYVFYDKSKSGLEYYKNVRGNILIAVRVAKGAELKVRSVYPVSYEKIENRKKKEEQMKLYNKYVIGVK